MSILNFDARTVAPLAALEPVPAGWYKVSIEKSNIKPTKAGDGGYLELVMSISEGAYQGRKLFWNLNLFNPSQQAQQIAYGQLSAICHVTGQYNVSDHPGQDGATPMLHNIPFFVNVTIDQGTKGPINNCKGCKDVNGNDPGKQDNRPAKSAPASIPAFSSPAPVTQTAPAFGAPPPQPQQFGQAGGTAPPGYTPQVATPVAPGAPSGAPWSAGNGQAPQVPQPPAAAPVIPQVWPMQGATTPAAPAAAPGQPWQQSGQTAATPPWVK